MKQKLSWGVARGYAVVEALIFSKQNDTRTHTRSKKKSVFGRL